MAVLEYVSQLSEGIKLYRKSDYAYTALIVTATLLSFLLNGIVMYWYRHHDKSSLSSRLYFWMATFDLLSMTLKPLFILKLVLPEDKIDNILVDVKVPARFVLIGDCISFFNLSQFHFYVIKFPFLCYYICIFKWSYLLSNLNGLFYGNRTEDLISIICFFVEIFLERSLFSHNNKAISDDYGSVVDT